MTSCSYCGRVFTLPKSEARYEYGRLVCRRPCTLRPLQVQPARDHQGIVRMRTVSRERLGDDS